MVHADGVYTALPAPVDQRAGAPDPVSSAGPGGSRTRPGGSSGKRTLSEGGKVPTNLYIRFYSHSDAGEGWVEKGDDVEGQSVSEESSLPPEGPTTRHIRGNQAALGQ